MKAINCTQCGATIENVSEGSTIADCDYCGARILIDAVETISGHPIVVEAATASAKRSIFRWRSKPTSRVLTYTFRVLKD